MVVGFHPRMLLGWGILNALHLQGKCFWFAFSSLTFCQHCMLSSPKSTVGQVEVRFAGCLSKAVHPSSVVQTSSRRLAALRKR